MIFDKASKRTRQFARSSTCESPTVVRVNSANRSGCQPLSSRRFLDPASGRDTQYQNSGSGNRRFYLVVIVGQKRKKLADFKEGD